MSKTDICELKSPKIYLYMGHAMDICEYGVLKTEIVPEGCIYVTIEECSKYSAFSKAQMLKGWIDNYDKNEKILSCPEDPEFRKKLAKLLQTRDQTKIHIHTPGSTYVDNMLSPWSIHPHLMKGFFFTHSGLLERQDIRAKIGVENYDCHENSKDGKFKKGSIPLYYMASRWPTESFIKNKLDNYNNDPDYITKKELEELSYKITKNASDLMREFPGIHYNVLCRGVADDCHMSKFRRMDSKSEQEARNKNRKTKKAGKKGVTLFNKFKKIVSKSRKNSRK